MLRGLMSVSRSLPLRLLHCLQSTARENYAIPRNSINTKAYISIAIRLRHDYDEKLLTCSFFARVESHRMEAGACDTS